MHRPPLLERYRDVLPLSASTPIVTLGEGSTPLIRAERLSAKLGVDLWLNTPERPLEASGTSGMKAALNGVPSLSILDGWWIEGCLEGTTGWAMSDRLLISIFWSSLGLEQYKTRRHGPSQEHRKYSCSAALTT